MKKLSIIPTPPSTKDAVNFNERADTFLAALPNLADELNGFISELESFDKNVSQRLNAILQKYKNTFESDKNKALADFNAEFEEVKKTIVAMVALKNDEFELTAQAVLNEVRILKQNFKAYNAYREKIGEVQSFVKAPALGYTTAFVVDEDEYLLARLVLGLSGGFLYLNKSKEQEKMAVFVGGKAYEKINF